MLKLAPIASSTINATTVLTDAEIRPVVEALQKQVNNDFRPAWRSMPSNFVPRTSIPPEGSCWLAMFDVFLTRRARSLGYHDLPLMVCPAESLPEPSPKFGAIWSVTASHELLKMLADPNINLTVVAQTAASVGTLQAYDAMAMKSVS